jgi:hypothetical protein
MLRSGQALTPFVLYSLLENIDAMTADETGRIVRALEFIRSHVDADGALGRADPEIVEYPVYSTAYAVLCFKRAQAYRHLRRAENGELILRMERFLRDSQFDESNGFARDHVAFGGWGFDAPKQPGDPGHMDLAHTRRALQALAVGQPHEMGDIFLRANVHAFLQIVQKHNLRSTSSYDGGFYFSPVVLAANKGREEVDSDALHFRSYATATCDGILALLAAGVPRGDERVEKAIAWLRAHDDLDYPQGVPTDYAEPWGDAIRFYHYAVRAEAYAALDWPGDWRSQLAAAVAKTQAADGSFRNDASPLMKEDDPLMCTALAVVALGCCAR